MAAALAILQKEVRQKDETILELDRQIKGQQATIERMQHRMEDLLRRLYGRRSEKLDINQLLMDGLILNADGEAQAPEPPPQPESPVKTRPKSKHKGRCGPRRR